MAGESQTERIRKLELATAVILNRADNLDLVVEKVQSNSVEASRLLQDLDKRLALVVRDVERLEKRLDELLSRRWELWKVFLAAFLGSILTVAAGFVSRSLDRWIGVEPKSIAPAPKRGG